MSLKSLSVRSGSLAVRQIESDGGGDEAEGDLEEGVDDGVGGLPFLEMGEEIEGEGAEGGESAENADCGKEIQGLGAIGEVSGEQADEE